MSNPIWLDCSSPEDIPSIDRLRELATATQHVVLQFPPPFTHDEKCIIIAELEAVLSDWSVFDSGGMRSTENITVKKVIDRKEIIAHSNHIIDAARDFRAVADLLCRQLAEKKQIEPSALLANRDRGGTLQGDWEYFFHGLQCRFQNKKTKQVVEVELDFGEEFGALDPYFFGLFIATTSKFRELSKIFPDSYHDTRRALDVLAELGHLDLIRHDAVQTKSRFVAR